MGGPKRRVWRKIHICIDEQTLEIRAVEITGSNTGDAPMLPHLLNQIARDQEIGSVTAHGAYDTRRCHNTIADRGAAAVIPPRRNAQPWKPTTAGAIARNDALRESKYLGRALWRHWSGYHRRSRVETKMHCMKLLGHDYKRHGTTTLFAALDVKSGTVIGDCMPRHRAKEFLKFLRQIDKAVPARRDVHLVLDNYATHKTPEVKAWLDNTRASSCFSRPPAHHG